MYTHTHKHKMPPLAAAFHLVRKLTGSEPNNACVCMCVSCCMPVMRYVDKVNLSKQQRRRVPNTNQWDSENDRGWGKEKVFIHPQLPHNRVCLYSQLSVCFQTYHCVYVRVWVCVCYMNTALWLVCEVTDSFIMAFAHRETAPSRGRREEDRDMGQAGLLSGQPTSVQRLVEEKGWEGGTAAVSFNEPRLLSSAFNLQGCPELPHSTPLTPNPKIHTQLFQSALFLSGNSQVKSVIVKLTCRLLLIRWSHLGQSSNVTSSGAVTTVKMLKWKHTPISSDNISTQCFWCCVRQGSP